MKDFIDKTSTQKGTPINRSNLLAIQGFEAVDIVFWSNGNIVETNSDGHTLTTTFGSDGSIKETFVGSRTITRTTKFDGSKIIVQIS